MITQEQAELRAEAIQFFRRQGKKGITTWLEGSPFDGVVRESIVECFRASIEGNGAHWKIGYNRLHTNMPSAPPPKGMMDISLVTAGCLVDVLALDLDGQVYPSSNFPTIPGSTLRPAPQPEPEPTPEPDPSDD